METSIWGLGLGAPGFRSRAYVSLPQVKVTDLCCFAEMGNGVRLRDEALNTLLSAGGMYIQSMSHAQITGAQGGMGQ